MQRSYQQTCVQTHASGITSTSTTVTVTVSSLKNEGKLLLQVTTA